MSAVTSSAQCAPQKALCAAPVRCGRRCGCHQSHGDSKYDAGRARAALLPPRVHPFLCVESSALLTVRIEECISTPGRLYKGSLAHGNRGTAASRRRDNSHG
eukprot:TRINITY_DN9942_c1_g1_i1.p1 TRINITY_DN9942_c1_g1~~TRINITY_DN9942_c1_g1_i1.p1  ORF type:complete len:102 (-),score=4.77 TRINITY_DN9942_c1_g1_i1:535-840(-)